MKATPGIRFLGYGGGIPMAQALALVFALATPEQEPDP